VIARDGQLLLGEFIDLLKRQDPEEPVKFDFVHLHPTTLESYRGYYEDVSLGYSDEGDFPKVKDLIAHCESCLGRVFEGWKGGNHRPVTRDSTLWVANLGESGGTAIVGVEKHTYVTVITKLIDG
jgi:hypothetical protein